MKELYESWNNGKSGAKLDLTSSTTPGLQIHKFDQTRTANPCDWLPCRRAALLLVGSPHSLVYLNIPVVEGLIFCISATPHLGTSFPLFHGRAPPRHQGAGRESCRQTCRRSRCPLLRPPCRTYLNCNRSLDKVPHFQMKNCLPVFDISFLI